MKKKWLDFPTKYEVSSKKYFKTKKRLDYLFKNAIWTGRTPCLWDNEEPMRGMRESKNVSGTGRSA